MTPDVLITKVILEGPKLPSAVLPHLPLSVMSWQGKGFLFKPEFPLVCKWTTGKHMASLSPGTLGDSS